MANLTDGIKVMVLLLQTTLVLYVLACAFIGCIVPLTDVLEGRSELAHTTAHLAIMFLWPLITRIDKV